MFTILHGENDLEREEALAKHIQEAGIEPDLKDLNTEILDAPVTVSALKQACGTIPFLGSVRIVIAREVLNKTDKTTLRDIVTYLDDLPPTTVLCFVESKKLSQRHPVMTAAKKKKAKVVYFGLPRERALAGWIRNRVQSYGGQIDPGAAALLAQNIGDQLRLMDQEIQKLLLYSGEQKTIHLEDVKIMVPYVQSANVIFDMVDALGKRRPQNAAQYLHRLLDIGEHPLGIFGMIVRQFRLLIQVRWMVDRGYVQQEIVSRLKLHPFVANKIRNQTTYFTPEQLQTAYKILMESDISIKQGLIAQDTALDLLVAELTRI